MDKFRALLETSCAKGCRSDISPEAAREVINVLSLIDSDMVCVCSVSACI